MVARLLVYWSGKIKSPRITAARGTCQERLSQEVVESWMSVETAAEVNYLVVRRCRRMGLV